MKVLVTGGAGFIGSVVCRHLISDLNWSVVNLDKLTYAGVLASLDDVSQSPNYAFVHGDIADRDTVRRVFLEHQPDFVMNLAAETHVDRSIDDAQAFVRTNVVGTVVMLEEALRYWRGLEEARSRAFRFLHVSTDEVYGTLEAGELFREDTPYAPTSPYSASKAASDHFVSAWGHTYGLPVLISNCSNNFGPHHFPEKLIPLMIINGIEGRDLPVYGDGGQMRDWLFVDDHARALRMILERGTPGETYNIGARAVRANLDVVQQVCDLLDEFQPEPTSRRRLIRFVADRPGHDRRYAIDPEKVERDIGWRPSVSFEDGLRGTVRWYLDNADWWEPLRRRYTGHRLGSGAQASPEDLDAQSRS